MHIVMHGIKFTIYFGYSCMLLHVFSLIIIMGSHLSQKVSPQQAYAYLTFMFISSETPFNSGSERKNT